LGRGRLEGGTLLAASEVLGRRSRRLLTLNDEHVSTEHLLLAIMGLENDPASLLARHGASREAVLSVLMTVRSPRQVAGQTSEAQGRALELYARDLTELARRGKLDPVIVATMKSGAWSRCYCAAPE